MKIYETMKFNICFKIVCLIWWIGLISIETNPNRQSYSLSLLINSIIV